MKYKDLPKYEILNKLQSVSFSKPTTNLRVYRWCDAVSKQLNFAENERAKLVKKYGSEDESGNWNVDHENIEKFFKEWDEVIDMEIQDEIPALNVSFEDFEDENCFYPKEKEQWLSPKEIGYICKYM